MARRSTISSSYSGTLALLLSLAIAFFCYQTLDHHDWPETSGRVIETRIIESKVHDHDTAFHGSFFVVNVKYEYTINDKTYTGEHSVKTCIDRKLAEEFAQKQYVKNQPIPVLYSPSWPGLSALRRSSI